MYTKALLLLASLFYVVKVFVSESVLAYYTGDQLLKVLYAVFAFAGIYFATNRDYYLPFLGPCAFPLGLLSPQVTPNNASTRVYVQKLPANTKVVYWASEPCESTGTCASLTDPYTAYSGFTNAGVTMTDASGNATFFIRNPQGYSVNKTFRSKDLKPHVHYRYVLPNKLLSKIFTQYINET